VTAHGARFRRLAEEGLPEWRVVAPDLRGHGRSTWDPPWNVEQLVSDIVDTMDAEALDRVPVLGHSYGGLLAMHLAARVPDRVERLVLIDPAVALAADEMLEVAEETRHDDGWATAEEARESRISLREPAGRWAVDEDLAVALQRDADGRYRMRYLRSAAITAWGEMARPPASLAGYPGEVLLIPALKEAMVGETLRSSLRADLGERLSERGIDGNHMLYWDHLDELIGILRTFLAAPR
jgi:lipase